MQILKILGLLALAGVLGVMALVIVNTAPRINLEMPARVTSFEECAAAGNPVMESYPRQCRSADGTLFVEEIPEPVVPPSVGLGLPAQGCAVAGCSGQLCVPAALADSIVSTCEYRAEYACFRDALCEQQANGQCGWTETPALSQCLASPPGVEETELEVM